jgi:dihydrofolate synthase/folylpolyglutamate synthase
MSSYSETVEWLFKQFPSYQKVGAKAYKPNLDNITILLRHLGNPEKKLQFIHVAGTNGKGSTSHLLASIFQEHGFKTGLFTSPHLLDFRERIKVNGKEIDEKNVIDFVAKIKNIPIDFSPSFFEISFAMALFHFNASKCTICIIETGLGGRLDSTNIITPLLSIITNIGLDHQQFLGDTREKIAGEKAGIIKQHIPVLVAQKDTETSSVFENKAKQMKSKLHWVDFSLQFPTDLRGSYQQQNVATAYCATKILQSILKLKEAFILKGLKHVQQNNPIRGRMEIISNTPLTIIDAAHNEEGIIELMKSINEINFNRLHLIYGASSDKNVTKIVKNFPKDAFLYFSEFKNERSAGMNSMKENTSALTQNKQFFTSSSEAYTCVKSKVNPDDLIVIFGSFFLIEEFL